MEKRELKMLEVLPAPAARKTASSYLQWWSEEGRDASLWEAPFPLGGRGFRRSGHIFRAVPEGQNKPTVSFT